MAMAHWCNHQVLNPVLEAMALRYFDKDEMEQLQTSYEETVKQYIKWIQESRTTHLFFLPYLEKILKKMKNYTWTLFMSR